MKISKEALEIIITELEIASEHCNRRMASLPLENYTANTFSYWANRQSLIKRVIEELRQ